MLIYWVKYFDITGNGELADVTTFTHDLRANHVFHTWDAIGA